MRTTLRPSRLLALVAGATLSAGVLAGTAHAAPTPGDGPALKPITICDLHPELCGPIVPPTPETVPPGPDDLTTPTTTPEPPGPDEPAGDPVVPDTPAPIVTADPNFTG
jgi:hypothetical protein